MSKRKSRSGAVKGKKRREKRPVARQASREFLSQHSRTFDVVVIVLYFVLVALLFHQFLFSDGMLFGTDSIPSGVFFRGVYRDFVRQYHELPQWDPYILGGLPFIDAMHGDTFYPTSLLKFFMPLHRAMGFKLILHVFLAGVFMFLFLKSAKLNRYAATFGGLCYMFASIFVSLVYAGHDAKMFVMALLPLCFFLLERGLETRRFFYYIMLGGAIGLLILSSHIQMAYFALWGLGLYVLFRLVILWRDKKESRIVIGKMALSFVCALVIGLGFGLVQLLPSYVFVNNFSVREEKTGFDHATSWSLHAEEVASLIVPEFSGDSVTGQNTYWGRNTFKLNTEYSGIIPIILTVFALILFRSRRIIFFSICAVIAVIYGLGGDTPIFYLFYYFIPGVKIFRGPSMIMFLFSFAMCFTGAVGFHALLETPLEGRKRDRVTKGIAVACGIVLLTGILITGMKSGLFSLWTSTIYTSIAPPQREAMFVNIPRFLAGLWIVMCLFLATAGLVWARLKGKISSLLFLGLLVPLVLIDTWRINAQFIKVVNPNTYLGGDRAISFLQQREREEGPFRVFPVGRAYGENMLGVHRVESVTGFHDNELKWYNAFTRRDRRNLLMSPFLDVLNVKYLLWDPREKALQPYFDQMKQRGIFREVFDGGRVKVFENMGALPRAWVASHYEVADSSGIFQRLSDPTFDYRNTVLLEEDPGVESFDVDSLGVGRVERIAYIGNRIEVDVMMERPGFLVLSDNYFPYWQVRVDGETQKIFKADYTVRAVLLEPGNHSVLFTYHSRPFRTGSLVSGFLLLFLCGAVLVEAGSKFIQGKGGAKQ